MAAPPDPRLFAALADPTRLALIDHLRRAPSASITELTADTTLTRQAVTKHLAVLAEADLVRSARDGRERRWTLHAAPLAALSAWSTEVRAEWEARFDRLEAFLSTSPTIPEEDP